jgi:formylglycine-generating enzyme required for sulfatase activity
MTLVLVPAGEYLMGSPDSDPTAMKVEKPRHKVRISRPFYLGAHEVTLGQFRAFVAATRYRTEAEASGEGGTVYNGATKLFEPIPECNWRNPGLPLPQSDDEPVVQVSGNDAMAFCRWLSDQEHRVYRLPTEAEWEYACRANTTTRWCMGDDPAQLDPYAWVRDQVGCSTHPVGQKKPNAFGLYDMHGNVWEWCLDRFRAYPDAPEVDPSGGLAGPVGVLRGGACSRAEVDRTRSAARLKHKPSYRFNKYGFRVCCPLAATAVGP